MAKKRLVFDTFHSNHRRELERLRSNSRDWLVDAGAAKGRRVAEALARGGGRRALEGYSDAAKRAAPGWLHTIAHDAGRFPVNSLLVVSRALT